MLTDKVILDNVYLNLSNSGFYSTTELDVCEAYHQEKLKQEIRIETPWDWFGWLQARVPNLETKHKLWVQQCVKDLISIKLKKLEEGSLTLIEIEDKIDEIFESNNKEFKGSNESFLHFKEELAEWILDKLTIISNDERTSTRPF